MTLDNNWSPDYNNAVEETTGDINPMEYLGVDESEDIHVVEDDKSYEEEFEKLLKEEEIEKVVTDTPVSVGPTLKKSKQNTLRTSKLNFNRSTGGSRLSKVIGKDNDVIL